MQLAKIATQASKVVAQPKNYLAESSGRIPI